MGATTREVKLYFTQIDHALAYSIGQLVKFGQEVDTGHWQGVETEGRPDMVTDEVRNLSWVAKMPEVREEAAIMIQPNLPWAEDHFRERVSRAPTNPGEQYKNWPWWGGQMRQTSAGTESDRFIFTHTYQERFWPKRTNGHYNHGIRYRFGDLDDVVRLLDQHPFTRQATLPIFFPEDTGAVHGGRIPCTLHYHFLRRGNALHLWYPIRSCDAVRHFRDDIYMSVRLAQWMIEELNWVEVRPGDLHFTAYSFHVHRGDKHVLTRHE